MEYPDMQRIESLETLLAREEEVAREWQWLHDALNEVARGESRARRCRRVPAHAATAPSS
jgi:hypothetical protein